MTIQSGNNPEINQQLANQFLSLVENLEELNNQGNTYLMLDYKKNERNLRPIELTSINDLDYLETTDFDPAFGEPEALIQRHRDYALGNENSPIIYSKESLICNLGYITITTMATTLGIELHEDTRSIEERIVGWKKREREHFDQKWGIDESTLITDLIEKHERDLDKVYQVNKSQEFLDIRFIELIREMTNPRKDRIDYAGIKHILYKIKSDYGPRVTAELPPAPEQATGKVYDEPRVVVEKDGTTHVMTGKPDTDPKLIIEEGRTSVEYPDRTSKRISDQPSMGYGRDSVNPEPIDVTEVICSLPGGNIAPKTAVSRTEDETVDFVPGEADEIEERSRLPGNNPEIWIDPNIKEPEDDEPEEPFVIKSEKEINEERVTKIREVKLKD